MTLGDFIKEYRRQHGMSQRDFADKAGITNAYISMLERGANSYGKQVVPSFKTIKQVADACHISVDELAAQIADSVLLPGEVKQLTEREQLIALIDSLPEEKIRAILALLQGL